MWCFKKHEDQDISMAAAGCSRMFLRQKYHQKKQRVLLREANIE
jgi:hypothetical protein